MKTMRSNGSIQSTPAWFLCILLSTYVVSSTMGLYRTGVEDKQLQWTYLYSFSELLVFFGQQLLRDISLLALGCILSSNPSFNQITV